MTDQLRKSFQSLRTLSPQLNKATDEAIEVVKLVEKFLNDECSLGVPASVYVMEATDGQGYTSLAYERVNGKFRIAVETTHLLIEDGKVVKDDYDDGVVVGVSYAPWMEAPRVVKLKTFEKLPALLAEIENNVTESIKAVSESSAIAKEMLGAMGAGNPDAMTTEVIADLAPAGDNETSTDVIGKIEREARLPKSSISPKQTMHMLEVFKK